MKEWELHHHKLFAKPSNVRFLRASRFPEQPVFQAFPPNNNSSDPITVAVEALMVVACAVGLVAIFVALAAGWLG